MLAKLQVSSSVIMYVCVAGLAAFFSQADSGAQLQATPNRPKPLETAEMQANLFVDKIRSKIPNKDDCQVYHQDVRAYSTGNAAQPHISVMIAVKEVGPYSAVPQSNCEICSSKFAVRTLHFRHTPTSWSNSPLRFFRLDLYVCMRVAQFADCDSLGLLQVARRDRRVVYSFLLLSSVYFGHGCGESPFISHL